MSLSNDARSRLDLYLQGVGDLLGHPARRIPFATYVVGLFSTLERKTAEGIAALSAPEIVEAEHQRLLHIIGQSTWDDRLLRRYSWQQALKATCEHRQIDGWIIDDTGWIKKGNHSVGVQRQYTGTSGKIDNCQVGVSLCVSAGDVQLPIDFELYLPRTWVDDDERRRKAKIPDDLEFKTKPNLAVEMIDRALQDGLPHPTVVLADAGYGNSSDFRLAIRARRLHYAVAVVKTTKVHAVDSTGARRGPATTVDRMAAKATHRRVTWRKGTKGALSSRFAFRRVVPVRDADESPEPNAVWLITEWPYDESEPCKYYLCSLAAHTSHKQLVFAIHQRFRTERMYEDLKQEFGLDHYEGRSFVGWHHHVTAVLVAYSFAAAEQSRLFPPEQTDRWFNTTLHCAA
jgi:SRSO17 transposase